MLRIENVTFFVVGSRARVDNNGFMRVHQPHRIVHANRSLAAKMAQRFRHTQRHRHRDYTRPQERVINNKVLKLIHKIIRTQEIRVTCANHGLCRDENKTAIIAYRIALMRRTLLLCTLVFTLLCAATAIAQSNSERARQARAELQQLQAKIGQVKDAISAGREQHDELAEKLTRAGQAVRDAAHKLDKLSQSIAAIKQKVASLEQARDREKAHLGDELDTLRAQVRARYRNGQTNKLRLLLSGTEPAQVGRMLVYYEYFARAQAQQIAELQDMLADLGKRQTALEHEQQQLTARQQARAATLAHLKRSRHERAATLKALEQRIAAQESTLDDYQTAAQRLEELLGTLNTKLTEPAHTPPGTFTALKGRMQPPLEGTILARFGSPKAKGRLRWQGQWRGAPQGTPVHAVAAGRVVYIGYLHHYGLVVVLQHADNYFTVYGHVQSSYVEVGDRVERNEAIARAGHSGGHRRSGVYFEIRKGEQALDPSRWLAG